MTTLVANLMTEPVLAQRLRVLIVDDCKDTTTSFALLGRAWGHEVLVANAGETGLTLALDSQPDVVILDIGLPDMSGWELAERLRALLNGVYLIAVSGHGMLADRERSRKAGCDLHLIKPANPVALREVLARQVYKKGPSSDS